MLNRYCTNSHLVQKPNHLNVDRKLVLFKNHASFDAKEYQEGILSLLHVRVTGYGAPKLFLGQMS